MPALLPADWPLYLFPLVGHVALWIAIVNYIHATGLPRWAIKALTVAAEIATVAMPLRIIFLLAAWRTTGTESAPGALGSWDRLPPLWQIYLAALCLLTALLIPWWIVRRVRTRPPSALRSSQSMVHDLSAGLDHGAAMTGLASVFARIPGNESLKLEISEKTLEIQRLPERLTGLSIAHISDLHFTGRIGKAYFERVIELTNELQADLIAVTGDLVETEPCFSWINDTLARLTARCGVFFILGNHDLRSDPHRLRRTLVEAGQVYLGGSWQMIEIDGERVLLAGNELPWITPAADVSGSPQAGLRILLSHSPDQFEYARRHEFDLMLAGHTHGGQVQLPWLGPIVAPSRFGVKYASGTFYEFPTLMHVSRGVSGEIPWRWNCLPEITKLTLVPATHSDDLAEERPVAAVDSR
jgi:predicted MPP superfamily phosphohydrolase